MEWLKKILEQAKVNEEGKIDIDAVMKLVNAEFPKHAVPKEDYNSKATELKTANDTIRDLKKQNEGNEDLQSKIKEYETEVGNLKKENESIKKTTALERALEDAGCLDPGSVIYKHGGLDKFNFDESGKPIGVEEVTKSYRETMAHVFKPTEPGGGYHPAGGGDPKGDNPWAKETFNLTKQGEIYKNNPAQAKELMAAAGIKQ